MTTAAASSSQAPDADGVAVFISYSREDADVVRSVHGAVVDAGRRVWVDWEDIPPSADWRSEIGAGTDAADGFVFVLSPDTTAPAELASRNWILCRADDDFDDAMRTLARALDTDLDWVRAHTRLLVRARECERKRRDGSLLLRGADLRGRGVARRRREREPEPTQLQREYVLAGRRAAMERQRVTLTAVVVALVVAAGLAVLAFLQRDQAVERTSAGRSRTNAPHGHASSQRARWRTSRRSPTSASSSPGMRSASSRRPRRSTRCADPSPLRISRSRSRGRTTRSSTSPSHPELVRAHS